MKQRGRQSVDAQNAVQPLREVPQPPHYLDEIARELWEQITADAAFKKAALPLLESYVSAYARMRKYQKLHDELITQGKDGEGYDYEGIDLFNGLIAKEANLLNSTATKLRITPSSERKEGRKAPIGPAPWEQ
jgi:phage terminase small subunit